MNNRAMGRILLISCLVAILSGCSAIKLVYQQLDWLLPHYLDDYVSLTPEQASQFDRELALLREWHCGTQLRDYAQWLRTAGRDVQTDASDYAIIAMHYAGLEHRWTRFMGRVSEHVARLVPRASDAQVVELFRNLETENNKLQAEIERSTPEQRRRRSVERMERQLERWIGDLTPAQHDAVLAWSVGMAGGDTDRLEARLAWQREFWRLLQRRHDGAALSEGLRRLFVEPERFRPVQLTQNRLHRREATLRLVATIAAALTPAQRASTLRRAERWARDFDDLVCAEKAERAAPPRPRIAENLEAM